MANPKSNEGPQYYIDQKPFDGFCIRNSSALENLKSRHKCPKCGKSRKYYCYSCYVPILELEGMLPVIKLPIKIDIIKHKREIDGKSTAGHAAILAPDDVSIYTYPNFPDYSQEKVVLIFPSVKAISIDQLINGENYNSMTSDYKLPKGFNPTTLLKINRKQTSIVYKKTVDQLPITKAIFIDSTWNQSNGIFQDERLKNLQCVVIGNRISQFWRHQKGSPRWYLATIEAIHQFLIELHLNIWGLHPEYNGIKNCFSESILNSFKSIYSTDDLSYNGQYDNLLYFFKHMYYLIHEYYDHANLFAYQRRLM